MFLSYVNINSCMQDKKIIFHIKNSIHGFCFSKGFSKQWYHSSPCKWSYAQLNYSLCKWFKALLNYSFLWFVQKMGHRTFLLQHRTHYPTCVWHNTKQSFLDFCSLKCICPLSSCFLICEAENERQPLNPPTHSHKDPLLPPRSLSYISLTKA